VIYRPGPKDRADAALITAALKGTSDAYLGERNGLCLSSFFFRVDIFNFKFFALLLHRFGTFTDLGSAPILLDSLPIDRPTAHQIC